MTDSQKSLLSALTPSIGSGTLVLESGRSCGSRLIRGVTCSRYSHVAVLSWIDRSALTDGGGHWSMPVATRNAWQARHLLFEASIQAEGIDAIQCRPVAGVQCHEVWPRLAEDAYRKWLLRPIVPLTATKSRLLAEYLLWALGTPYDGQGAFLAGTRLIKRLWQERALDATQPFCSELAENALLHAGVVPAGVLAPGLDTPALMARKLVRTGIYHGPVEVLTE